MSNKKKVSKNLIWAVISLLLAVLTVRLVLKQSSDLSFTDLCTILKESDKLYMALAALASLLFIWFEGSAIRSILRRAGYKRGPLSGLLFSTSDIYFSAITPSATGGQPASAFFMIRSGISAGITTATLVLNLMMYTLSIIALGIISIIISPKAFTEFGSASRVFIIICFVVMLLLATGFFLLLKNESIIFKPACKIISFLTGKNLIRNKEHLQMKIEKTRADYKACSDLISGHRGVLIVSFIWNFLQRTSQIMVPMLVYAALGGEKSLMPAVFSKQCLITIGYNFVPIPGGMGISDYLMIDGLRSIMESSMAYSVELISRGLTFYICVLISGIITLIGYLIGKRKEA